MPPIEIEEKEIMKQLVKVFLGGLIILSLEGCQSMPKDPKTPDSSPRVPINKTIPPEIQDAGLPQESLYETPAY